MRWSGRASKIISLSWNRQQRTSHYTGQIRKLTLARLFITHKPLRVTVTTLMARRATSVPQGQSATVPRHKTAEDAGHRMWPRTEGIHLTSKCHRFSNRLQTVGRCWHKRVYFVWSNVWVGSVAQRMSTWIPRNSVFEITDKFFFYCLDYSN